MTAEQAGEPQALAYLSDPRNYQAIRKKQEELKKPRPEKEEGEKSKEPKPKLTKEQQAAL